MQQPNQYDIVDMRMLECHLPQIAVWHHQEWLRGRASGSQEECERVRGRDLREREHSLRSHLGRETIPTSFIAHNNGQPLGTVSLVNYRFSQERLPRHWLTNLFVAKPFRRRGIAANLLQHCVNYAKGLGLSEVNLYTRNLADYYAQRGWQLSHHGIVQGQRVDILKMSFSCVKKVNGTTSP